MDIVAVKNFVYITMRNKTELPIYLGKISGIGNFPWKITETFLGKMLNIRHDFIQPWFGNFLWKRTG